MIKTPGIITLPKDGGAQVGNLHVTRKGENVEIKNNGIIQMYKVPTSSIVSVTLEGVLHVDGKKF